MSWSPSPWSVRSSPPPSCRTTHWCWLGEAEGGSCLEMRVPGGCAPPSRSWPRAERPVQGGRIGVTSESLGCWNTVFAQTSLNLKSVLRDTRLPECCVCTPQLQTSECVECSRGCSACPSGLGDGNWRCPGWQPFSSRVLKVVCSSCLYVALLKLGLSQVLLCKHGHCCAPAKGRAGPSLLPASTVPIQPSPAPPAPTRL